MAERWDPQRWLSTIAFDPGSTADVRAMAAASLTNSAGRTRPSPISTRTDLLGEVLANRRVFGAVAAAAAGGELWRRLAADGPEREDAERALRVAGINRRSVLRGIAGAAMITGTSSLLAACDMVLVPSPIVTNGVTPSTNLLQIVIDDLNDYVGFLGGCPGAIHTPNLDALAAQSLSFEQFHISVPICAPSRATLMWGVDAPTHGVYGLFENINPIYNAYAASNPDHLLKVLGSNGFRQVGGGKIFHDRLGMYLPKWDAYFKNKHVANVGPIGPDSIWFDYGTLPSGAAHPDNQLTDFLLGEMQTIASSRPFHMAAGYRLPHLGWIVPQEYLDLYPLEEVVVEEVVDDWDDIGPIGRDLLGDNIALYDPAVTHSWLEWVELYGNRQVYLQHYLASISYVDYQVGRLLDGLASQPYADETAVTLVSDNGYHHGENAMMRKGALRDQSTRVPFLIRHPDIPPQTFTTPVSSLNYAPTLLGLLGVDAPSQMEGVDLLEQLPTGFISSYFGGRDGLSISQSIISTDNPRYRWVFHTVEHGHPRYNDGAIPGIPEIEVYDRLNDPGETINLVA
ncbi:MAG: sulfatase-like hydrolase/transferase [Acidimicrobiales bacterium]